LPPSNENPWKSTEAAKAVEIFSEKNFPPGFDRDVPSLLKNRALFAFVSGRLGEFYSGSGASIQPRNAHDFSKHVVYFVVVPVLEEVE
jgi:hypothetical protein